MELKANILAPRYHLPELRGRPRYHLPELPKRNCLSDSTGQAGQAKTQRRKENLRLAGFAGKQKTVSLAEHTEFTEKGETKKQLLHQAQRRAKNRFCQLR